MPQSDDQRIDLPSPQPERLCTLGRTAADPPCHRFARQRHFEYRAALRVGANFYSSAVHLRNLTRDVEPKPKAAGFLLRPSRSIRRKNGRQYVDGNLACVLHADQNVVGSVAVQTHLNGRAITPVRQRVADQIRKHLRQQIAIALQQRIAIAENEDAALPHPRLVFFNNILRQRHQLHCPRLQRHAPTAHRARLSNWSTMRTIRMPLPLMRVPIFATFSSGTNRARYSADAITADNGVRRSWPSTAMSISLASRSCWTVASCVASCCFCFSIWMNTSTFEFRIRESYGLYRKSTAPASYPRNVRPVSCAVAVRKMIGTCAVRGLPRISSASSKPSMPGMLTSRMASATSCLSSSSSAAGPDAAASTEMSGRASDASSAVMLFCTSSTIRT